MGLSCVSIIKKDTVLNIRPSAFWIALVKFITFIVHCAYCRHSRTTILSKQHATPTLVLNFCGSVKGSGKTNYYYADDCIT